MHPPGSYYTKLAALPGREEMAALAERVYRQIFRVTFDFPGFSLIAFSSGISSQELRAFMVGLKTALSDLYFDRTGKYLIYQSMDRFDQQNTTKFHLDGAPHESFLMLGYEPTEVASNLAMADYSQVAWKLGIEPEDFIRDHNPMYQAGAKMLEALITPLDVFDPRHANVLIVNNSCQAFDETGKNTLGVMHQATIPHPDATTSRIINSTMLRTTENPREEKLTPDDQARFMTTTLISEPVSY